MIYTAEYYLGAAIACYMLDRDPEQVMRHLEKHAELAQCSVARSYARMHMRIAGVDILHVVV